MESASTQDIQKHLRIYIGVFVALLVGTLLTVAASRISMGGDWNIGVALAIAIAKAALVAGFFMHLTAEKRLIYLIVAFALVFFFGLMFLTLYATADHISLAHVS